MCKYKMYRYFTPNKLHTILGITGIIGYTWYNKPVVEACGIMGYISDNESQKDAKEYLIEGLTILQNRGYDSAGISTMKNSTISTTKFASINTTSDSIMQLKQNLSVHKGHSIGIAHTRWATHGGRTDANAHPHLDSKERVAVVHNGTIENYEVLRKKLVEDGITFKSSTDTEVIAQMIGLYMDKNYTFESALSYTLQKLEGTWGLAILHVGHPNQIIAVRHGSPLVLGVGKGEMFISSEVGAFSRYTKHYVDLNEGEIFYIGANSDIFKNTKKIMFAEEQNAVLTPFPYTHWTLREIMEQPESIMRSMGNGSRISNDYEVCLGGLVNNRVELLTIKNLLITACGTSYYAGIYGTKLFRTMGVFNTVQSCDAAEFSVEILPKEIQTGVLVLSQSGETRDVLCALDVAKDVVSFSVVNQVGSLIARTTNCGVYVHAGRENAVASTKVFTCQVIILSLICVWFAQNSDPLSTKIKRKNLITAIRNFPIECEKILQTKQDDCKRIAQLIFGCKHLFVLGKGYAEPIALEGALKIKEITYIHAEGYSGGALKHGPFALIEEGTPIILIILDDEHSKNMCIVAEEVRSRGACTIIITNHDCKKVEHLSEYIIYIPTCGSLSALLAVIPLQLIAYYTAIERSIDPDKPRNLAKTVTVN